MSEEMKEITAVPTLTFEPFESEQGVLQTVRANEPSPEDAVFDESSLTDAEKKMVQDLSLIHISTWKLMCFTASCLR